MSTVTISRWGNSLALRIPKGVAEQECLKEGDSMSVEIDAGVLKLKKIRTIKKYTLEAVLPSCHTAEEAPELDWGVPQGREAW